MFKVLYAPFEGVQFERFQPWSRSKVVLVYQGPKGSRVLISCAKEVGTEVEMMEMAVEWLNHSPSLEFTRLMLRAIKDVWQEWKRGHESKLMRTLRFRSAMGLDKERPDGYW